MTEPTESEGPRGLMTEPTESEGLRGLMTEPTVMRAFDKSKLNWKKLKMGSDLVIITKKLTEEAGVRVSLAEKLKEKFDAATARAKALAMVFHLLKIELRIVLSGIIFIAWLFAGAAAMQKFEQPSEASEFGELEAAIAKMRESMGPALYVKLDEALRSFPSTGSMCTGWPIDTNSTSWDLKGSTFFMFQMVTTIGYGNQAPQTDHGRVFALFYTLLGFFIYGYLNIIISGCIEGTMFMAISKLAKLLRVHKHRQALCLLFEASAVLLWMVVMSAYYSTEEGWTFTDALYFAFISITTIGFGDIVPDRTRHSPISYLLLLIGVVQLVILLHSLLRADGIDRSIAILMRHMDSMIRCRRDRGESGGGAVVAISSEQEEEKEERGRQKQRAEEGGRRRSSGGGLFVAAMHGAVEQVCVCMVCVVIPRCSFCTDRNKQTARIIHRNNTPLHITRIIHRYIDIPIHRPQQTNKQTNRTWINSQ
jgi:hypothetical protein